MVDHPFGLLVEEGAARVDVDLVVVNKRPVAAFCVLSGSVEKETGNNGLADQGVVLTTGLDGETVSLKQLQQLFADVFSPSQTALLDEVFLGPGCTVALVAPGLKHLKVCEMIALKVVEFGLLLVCYGLLFLGTVEDVLDGKHGDYGDYFFCAAEVN